MVQTTHGRWAARAAASTHARVRARARSCARPRTFERRHRNHVRRRSRRANRGARSKPTISTASARSIPGAGDTGCESDACPSGYVCVAHNCERLGETDEVCSPCDRVVGGMCRCRIERALHRHRIWRKFRQSMRSRLHHRQRLRRGFSHCQATDSSGDFQCVASDLCASGPDPCKIDADCNNNGVCKSGACVGVAPPGEIDGGSSSDASTGDGGSSNDSPSSSGGCSCCDERNIVVGRSLDRRDRDRSAHRSKEKNACSSASILAGAARTVWPRLPTRRARACRVTRAGRRNQRRRRRRRSQLSQHRAAYRTPFPRGEASLRSRAHVRHSPQKSANDARWLIVPETFPYDGKDEPGPGKGAVSELKVLQMSARGRLIWCR